MREIEEASKKDCSSLVTSMKTYKIDEGSNKEFSLLVTSMKTYIRLRRGLIRNFFVTH